MSYHNDPDTQHEEERREGKEQAAIEKAEAQREETFYCYKEETGQRKCREICDKCLEIQQHLQK